jgi:hypothetical protein
VPVFGIENAIGEVLAVNVVTPSDKVHVAPLAYGKVTLTVAEKNDKAIE